MLSTPFEFQIVLTPKPMHRTESTTLALSLQKFPRTAVISYRSAPCMQFLRTSHSCPLLQPVYELEFGTLVTAVRIRLRASSV
jgi:hypothetical protein